MSGQESLRIFVADASSSFRELLCRFIRLQFPRSIVRGSDESVMFREIREFSPGIIILDTNFERLKEIREQQAGAKIIMLTAHDIPEYLDAAKRCGADHVFCKTTAGLPEIESMIEIISRAARDGT